MYNTATDIAMITSVVGGILSLIILITFFVIAFRLKKIMKSTQMLGFQTGDQLFAEAASFEFMDEKDRAIQIYIKCLYLVVISKYTITGYTRIGTFNRITDSIKNLNGLIPKKLQEENIATDTDWGRLRTE